MIEDITKFSLGIFFGLLFLFDKRTKTTPALEKVMMLYQSGDFSETFSKIRVWDAPLEAIEKMTNKSGRIVDLGCGDGLLVNYLALMRSDRRLFGIEINPARIQEAEKGIKNVEFKQGDILKNDFPVADNILLVHVLHHLPSYEDQVRLIEQCKNKLNRKGKLIIVEIVKRPLLKFFLTWVVDAIIFPILFEKKLFNFKIFYRSGKQWQNLLKRAGFTVKVVSAHKNKPFSHVIIEARI